MGAVTVLTAAEAVSVTEATIPFPSAFVDSEGVDVSFADAVCPARLSLAVAALSTTVSFAAWRVSPGLL
jgi:hypothetical protein